MSDNEFLLAITEIIDSKIKPLQEYIKNLNEKVSGLDEKVSKLDKKVSGLDEKVSGLDERIRKIELNQENKILPRLQNIEACYTSTYERYARGVDQIEGTVQDIKLMKKVITEHSIKLEKIS